MSIRFHIVYVYKIDQINHKTEHPRVLIISRITHISKSIEDSGIPETAKSEVL